MAEFAWGGDVRDPQAPARFRSSQLDWDEPARPPHAAMLEWYRRLIALRKSRPPTHDAPARVEFDESAGWLCLEHPGVLVACNFAAEERKVPLPAGQWRVVLAEPAPAAAGGAVPAGATVVYQR